jgi:glycosyltransferase involved in cell wall biosynthesis
MIRVLFTGKEHRVRRRETMTNPPKGVEIVPQQDLHQMNPDYLISIGQDKRTFTDKVKDFFRYNNHIPKKDLTDINLIYSPGKVLLNRFPWVIEIDNTAVLGYYDLRILSVLRPVIKQRLKSKHCKRIICTTKTVRTSMINYFKDPVIESKCTVVYPYVKVNPKVQKSANKVIFLCANTKFYMKGTLTVLKAFTTLAKRYKNIELWVISNTPQHILDEYAAHKNITFHKATFTKEQLYEQFYSKADVLVQPTLQDSIGLVYLEAMANKMAIITTDVFAIPEFVRPGKNGFLMEVPFDMYNPDRTPKWNYFPIRIQDQENDLYKPHNTNKKLLQKTEEYMERLIMDRKLLRSMQEESLRIIKTEFNEERRRNQLGAIFAESVQR